MCVQVQILQAYVGFRCLPTGYIGIIFLGESSGLKLSGVRSEDLDCLTTNTNTLNSKKETGLTSSPQVPFNRALMVLHSGYLGYIVEGS